MTLAMLDLPASADSGTKATVKVRTLLQGEVEVPLEEILHFSLPMLGFEHCTTFHLYRTVEGPLWWLQSLEEAKLAFCLLDLAACGIDPDYELGTEDAADLGIHDPAELAVFTVVVLDPDPQKMRTNLRAPVVVCRRTGRAKQLVYNDERLPIRIPLAELRTSHPFRRA